MMHLNAFVAAALATLGSAAACKISKNYLIGAMWVIYWWQGKTSEQMGALYDLSDAIFLGISNIIGFAVVFYIIYGILGLVGAGGTDKRREYSCWLTLIISFLLLSFAASLN